MHSSDTSPHSILDLVLIELRSLRTDFNEFRVEVAAKLAVADETHHFLMGNGQPGEITKIKDRVSKLERWRWQLTGMGLTVGCIAGYVARVAIH